MFGIKKILKQLESMPIHVGQIKYIHGFKVKHPIDIVAETIMIDKYDAEYLLTAPDLGSCMAFDIGIGNALRDFKLYLADEFEDITKYEDVKLGKLMIEKKYALLYYLEKD